MSYVSLADIIITNHSARARVFSNCISNKLAHPLLLANRSIIASMQLKLMIMHEFFFEPFQICTKV